MMLILFWLYWGHMSTLITSILCRKIWMTSVRLSLRRRFCRCRSSSDMWDFLTLSVKISVSVSAILHWISISPDLSLLPQINNINYGATKSITTLWRDLVGIYWRTQDQSNSNHCHKRQVRHHPHSFVSNPKINRCNIRLPCLPESVLPSAVVQR